MKCISLLIPAHNEEEALPLLYQEICATADSLPQYAWEFLFVDDGSIDGTLALLRAWHQQDERVQYISLSRNFGKEAAMLAGFSEATGDAVIQLDADLQDPPSLLPEMLKWWEEGYDDVYARRRLRGQESWLRRSLSLLFYRLLRHSTRITVPGNTGDFRLLDRRCVQALLQLPEHHRYTKGLYSWIGFRKKEILFDRQDRCAGKTSWSLLSLFALAIDGFLTFTTLPLRLATYLGLFVSTYGFCYGVWVIIKTLAFGEKVTGYASMMTVILFLGGVQLLSLGVIGEYLGRTFEETRRRPNFLIAERSTPRDN
jgi:glycosyltransferase involved in cell wall biosynthesis